MKKRKTFTIIQDTREQRPLDFSAIPDVEVVVDTCWPGDYTVRGFEKSIAFERKSVGDLIGTMKDGYVGKDSIRRYESRFDLELEEFERHYDRAIIIVEPDDPIVIREVAARRGISINELFAFGVVSAEEEIDRGLYRAMIPPDKIKRFLRSLAVKYGCHVYLAKSRADAAHELVEMCRVYIDARRHVIHRGKIAREEPEADAESKSPW